MVASAVVVRGMKGIKAMPFEWSVDSGDCPYRSVHVTRQPYSRTRLSVRWNDADVFLCAEQRRDIVLSAQTDAWKPLSAYRAVEVYRSGET